MDTQYLDELEILSLANFLKLSRPAASVVATKATGAKVLSLERARASRAKPIKSVHSQLHYSRLSYAQAYLDWLARNFFNTSVRAEPDAAKKINQMKVLIGKERPKAARKSRTSGRRALNSAERQKISNVIEVGREDNPFSPSLQKRNLLIVELYNLGIRGGELLAIKIEDIDFDGQTLLIPRRHNDPSDPRPAAPSAKTYDRRIPIARALRDLIEDYIISTRSSFKRAQAHSFLIVAQGNTKRAGFPLSGNSLKKVVASIRDASGVLNLSGHVWRHDAATRQAKILSSQGKMPEDQIKILSYLFGWSETGLTVSTYIESFIEDEARKASLSLQRVNRDGRS